MRILVMLDPTNKRGTKKPTQISEISSSPTDTCGSAQSSLPAEKQPKNTSDDYPNTPPAPVQCVFSGSQKKQYESIWYLTGSEDLQEKTVGRNCHVML